ncbi:hypothetical protein [Mycobacterium sp. M23085]|uniref:hypothetical protein n=1 Tax=Mycobacterium sp. M23085 TaxID=3378087 RepID=UPI0038781043
MSEASQEPVQTAGWVRQWVRDEKFWKDVASKTLSSLITSAVTAIAVGTALAISGFGTHHLRMQALKLSLAAVGIVMVLVLIFGGFVYWLENSTPTVAFLRDNNELIVTVSRNVKLRHKVGLVTSPKSYGAAMEDPEIKNWVQARVKEALEGKRRSGHRFKLPPNIREAYSKLPPASGRDGVHGMGDFVLKNPKRDG